MQASKFTDKFKQLATAFLVLTAGVPHMTVQAQDQVNTPEQRQVLSSNQTRDQITRNIKSFASFADQSAFEYLGALFNQQVTVDYTSAFGGEPAVVDRVTLMKQWADLLPGFDLTYHDISNIKVKISGLDARATADITASHYLTETNAEDDVTQDFWQINGYYIFKLKRVEEQWLIESLTLKRTNENGSREVLAKAAALAPKKLAAKQAQLVAL